MRALLDTDVVLDVSLQRAPFVEPAAALWLANDRKRFEGYVSAITPVNLLYVARKQKGSDVARLSVRELLSSFRVCGLNHDVLQAALVLSMRDFEDAVQVACATASQLDALGTRDVKDYAGATLPVFTPADFLKQLPTRA